MIDDGIHVGVHLAVAVIDILGFFFIYRWLFNNVRWFREQIR